MLLKSTRGPIECYLCPEAENSASTTTTTNEQTNTPTDSRFVSKLILVIWRLFSARQTIEVSQPAQKVVSQSFYPFRQFRNKASGGNFFRV